MRHYSTLCVLVWFKILQRDICIFLIWWPSYNINISYHCSLLQTDIILAIISWIGQRCRGLDVEGEGGDSGVHSAQPAADAPLRFLVSTDQSVTNHRSADTARPRGAPHQQWAGLEDSSEDRGLSEARCGAAQRQHPATSKVARYTMYNHTPHIV